MDVLNLWTATTKCLLQGRIAYRLARGLALRKCLHGTPVIAQQVPAARRPLCHADDFDAHAVVQPGDQLHVPGHHSCERIGTKAALAGQAGIEAGELHALAGFAPCCIQLRARTCRFAGEGAQQVGIEPADMFNRATQTRLQRGRDDPLLAMLGQQGDAAVCIGACTGVHHPFSVCSGSQTPWS